MQIFLLVCTDLVVATDHKPLLSILNDRCRADIENRRLRNVFVTGRRHLGPDAASRYPVGPAVKLQIPGEPSEANFSTKEVRHCILDILASIETAEADVAMAFISVVECSIEAMTDLHYHSCCTCTTTSNSAHNVVSWKLIKTATAEDNKMQDLMQYIMSGFPEDVLHCWNLPGNCYRRAKCVHRRFDTHISEELGCQAPSVFCC